MLESTLPRYAHDYIGLTARPRYGQLDLLNRVRRNKMCSGSQAPISELLSLRSYGRAISRSDGPSFRVNWHEDNQVVSWDDSRLSIAQFRQISHDAIESAERTCGRLMYSWRPSFDLGCVKDRLSNTAQGYSFVTDLANGLSEAYLKLSRKACLATVDGLMTDDSWDKTEFRRYLDWYDDMLQLLVVLIYLLGGQVPRGTELLTIEHRNGSSTSRGVCVYSSKIALICRHHKSRRTTNHEFHVVRFLPAGSSRICIILWCNVPPCVAENPA
jgi:hypothetical protein